MGPGTLFRERGRSGVGGRAPKASVHKNIVFSPNMNRYDARALYGEETTFCETWAEVLAILEQKHGASAKVCVLPCGAIQYGGG
jgi:putative hemolysin